MAVPGTHCDERVQVQNRREMRAINQSGGSLPDLGRGSAFAAYQFAALDGCWLVGILILLHAGTPAPTTRTTEIPPCCASRLAIINHYLSGSTMRPITQTTLNSSSSPNLVTTTIASSTTDTDTEALKKAEVTQRLDELIQTAGLQAPFTQQEYSQLSEDDIDRNPLNDLLILKKLPQANSPAEHQLISTLTRRGPNYSLELADFVLKENGSDTLKLIAASPTGVHATEYLLSKNPSITKLQLSVGRSAGSIHNVLHKAESVQEITISFGQPYNAADAKSALSQLAEKNNLKKLSIRIDPGLSGLVENNSTEEIDFNIHKIISANPHLNSIEIDGKLNSKEINLLFNCLKNIPNLTSIKFGQHMALNPNFSERLPEVLVSCNLLTNVEIQEYPTGTAAQNDLMDCIKNNPKIQNLKLDFQLISELPDPDGENSAQKLRAAMMEHPSLRSLNLTRNLSNETLESLFSGPPEKRTLQSLSFSMVKIGEQQAKIIANFIATSPGIEEIAINVYQIDPQHLDMIADAIKQSRYLTKFTITTHGESNEETLRNKHIYAEKIQPALDTNFRRGQAAAMAEKWGPAFGAVGMAPATAIPSDVAALLAQKLSEAELESDPLGAAQRTDRKMMEILLAAHAQAQAEQNATPVRNPTPTPAPSPSSSSSSSSASSSAGSDNPPAPGS